MICENITMKEVSIPEGRSETRLFFAGQDTVELAKKYGTPLYLMDEDRVRANCRVYKEAFKKYFGPDAYPLYASKANSFTRIYEIMSEEGMGIDLVSSGELFTAIQAGYDVSRAYFHGNNKTDFDISYGMENGVGYFVMDNWEEVEAIEREAAARGIKQKALLRLTPGIDPHTFEAVATGKVDSKFGNAIETRQAEEITLFAMAQPHIDLLGFHCHIGSQIFGEDLFEKSAEIMLGFIEKMEKSHGFKTAELNLGGGYGVRYVEDDPHIDIEKKISQVADSINKTCEDLGIQVPLVHMEPGRSIVADAGMTLYTVGSVKRIPGYKNYVSVDGGMPDNPRFALYGSKYTCLLAENRDKSKDKGKDKGKDKDKDSFVCSVVGRCCESGDIIQENVNLPNDVRRGDILAVCTTGAYNYSMASNYNRIPRPPIVMLRGGEENYIAVKRETFEDIARNDIK